MKQLKYPTNQQLREVLKRPMQDDSLTKQRVSQILADVKQNGDAALYRLNREIDGYASNSLEISGVTLADSKKSVSSELIDSITLAISNINSFHISQRPKDATIQTMPGVNCSIKFKPLERVGLYIPGGTAPLLSTVLMLAVPAMVAGCKELIICTPPNPTPELLYTLSLFNARIFSVGGAQAVAAMAFGTETIPKVDKIFGPGNRYVTEAKMQVAALGIPIDMPAGPSEVLVIAHEMANPSFVAADLLSQAEHGTDSQVILICTNEEFMGKAMAEVNRHLETLPRKDIAIKSLESSWALLVNSLDEAMSISNEYAPEHLILAVENPSKLTQQLENAGSVFLGHYTPESVGDYTSGTNHTLPTSGFARNWSGVNLLSFMKTITFQELTREGLGNLANATTTLARAEGLEAHARAVEERIRVDSCSLLVDSKTNFNQLLSSDFISCVRSTNSVNLSKKLDAETINLQRTTINLLRNNIKSLKPYSSARDEFEGEASVWLDANESPTPLPNLADGINRYPDPLQKDLKMQLAKVKNVATNQIFIGNGSDEAVDLLYRCFCNPTIDKVLVFPPTYGMYSVCAGVNDVEVIESKLDENFNINLNDFQEKNRSNPKLTFICNPNNPTGNTQKPDTIRQIIEQSTGIVVVDEAYVDFCPDKSVLSWINRYPNLVVLQTLSKAWGLAGARVGLAFASPEIIGVMNKVKFPYNVGKPSLQIASMALLIEKSFKERVDEITTNREKLVKSLENLPIVKGVFPSEANFLLVKFDNPKEIYTYLAQNGVVVRDRSTQPGCQGCLRITVGTKEEVEKLLSCLRAMDNG